MTLWAFGFEAIGVIDGSNFKLLCYDLNIENPYIKI